MLDDPEVDLIENITLSDKVKISEISNPTKVSGVIPSKNDKVLYHDEISDTWEEATVNRAGKATGSNKYWFNIQDGSDQCMKSINFGTI